MAGTRSRVFRDSAGGKENNGVNKAAEAPGVAKAKAGLKEVFAGVAGANSVSGSKSKEPANLGGVAASPGSQVSLQ